jgi:hypothetical protein
VIGDVYNVSVARKGNVDGAWFARWNGMVREENRTKLIRSTEICNDKHNLMVAQPQLQRDSNLTSP